MDFPETEIHKFSKQKRIKLNKYDKNDSKFSVSKNINLVKMVSIILPDSDLTNLITSINKDIYYEIQSFCVADMLCKSTIDGYINMGELFCISRGNFQNIQFSVLMRKMKISIARDVLLSLGAVYLRQFQKAVDDDYHHFEIDLTYKHMDKLRSELRSDLLDKVKIHFKWQSPKELCPSSIAKYFTDMNYSVEALRNKTKTESLYGLQMPLIPTQTSDDDNEDVRNFSELLGMILLRCDIEDNNCSSYEIANDKITDVGRGKILHLKGFLTSIELEELCMACNEILLDNSFPFISMTVIYHIDTLNCADRTIILSPDNIFVIQ